MQAPSSISWWRAPCVISAMGLSPSCCPFTCSRWASRRFQVGLVATAALLGSALLTLGVGMIGSRYDHRRLLLAAAMLMVATGVAFSVVDAYAVLLVVAFAGTINPSGGSVSVFVPLEHAVLTRDVSAADPNRACLRATAWSALWPALSGALAAAAPDFLASPRHGATDGDQAHVRAVRAARRRRAATSTPASRRTPRPSDAGPPAALGPSRHIVYRLAALFSIDAFAGGFVVQSLLALWLFERFDMSLSAASLFFFWSGVLAAFSFPVAAWLSRRIGLVNTMVFTHIPSSLCLILAAFSPSLSLALALLLIRAALSQMDVPTRSSYVMAVVTRGRAPGGRELHLRAAQPGLRDEPGPGRRDVQRRRCRLGRWSSAAP